MRELVTWHRKRGKKRDQIVSGATKIFAEKGFHRATMDEIAKAAGVGKGTLYYYAPSKRALFFFLVESIMEKVEKEVFVKIREEDGVIEKIKTLIYNHLTFVYSQEEVLAKIIVKMGGLEQDFLEKVPGIWDWYASFAVKILEEGKAKGLIKPDLDCWVAARALLAMITFTAWQLVLSGEEVSLDKATETISEVYLSGVTVS